MKWWYGQDISPYLIIAPFILLALTKNRNDLQYEEQFCCAFFQTRSESYIARIFELESRLEAFQRVVTSRFQFSTTSRYQFRSLPKQYLLLIILIFF